MDGHSVGLSRFTYSQPDQRRLRMTSNVLPLFWTLASSSKDIRLSASADLVSSLEGFQRSFLVAKADAAASSEDDEPADRGEDEDSDDADGGDNEVGNGGGDDDESGVEVDGSDEDEGERDMEAARLEEALVANNAEDVSYTVKRLVRGLSSSRESSRLGFAVALTEVRKSCRSITLWTADGA